MDVTTWQGLENQYDDMLNDVYGMVTVAGMEYDTASTLREIDPVAYRCGLLDYADGELVDLVPFCSDGCHQDWCRETGWAYDGWSGCHEGSGAGEWCEQCGVICEQPDDWDACTCGRDNVVVGRFPVDAHEYCEHGLIIQAATSRKETYK